MAESVDALVSNTSGATRAGSTPALGTRLESKVLRINIAALFLLFSTLLFGGDTNKIPHNYPKDNDTDKSHGDSCIRKKVTFREIHDAMKCSA